MTVVGIGIVPHDPEEYEKYHDGKLLYEAMLGLEEIVATLRPDVIFLSSPHGILNRMTLAISK